MELLAIMEGPSSHPLAATLVKAAKDEGIETTNIPVIDHSMSYRASHSNCNCFLRCCGFDRLRLRLVGSDKREPYETSSCDPYEETQDHDHYEKTKDHNHYEKTYDYDRDHYEKTYDRVHYETYELYKL